MCGNEGFALAKEFHAQGSGIRPRCDLCVDRVPRFDAHRPKHAHDGHVRAFGNQVGDEKLLGPIVFQHGLDDIGSPALGDDER